jgi:periplasmic protein TonB
MGLVSGCLMRIATVQHFRADGVRTPFGRRAVAFTLTVIIELLLLLILLKLGAPGRTSEKRDDLKTVAVTLRPPPPPARRDQSQVATEDAPTQEDPAAAEPVKDAQPQPEKERQAVQKTNARPVPAATAAPLVPLSGKALAGFDLSKIPRGAGASGTNPGKGPVYGPPGGVPSDAQLLDADWLRQPTRGELAAYFPARSKPGWGMIACQTAPRYRVENCHALRDSPGSGLAQALRRAAWQFQVIPPRVDGRAVMGAWVRIRFDFTEAKAPDAPVIQEE